MATWNPYEDEPPRRGRGCGCLLSVALLAAVGGGGAWWLAEASPWADTVRARLADSPVGREWTALEARWADSPVGRFSRRLLALGLGGDRLAHLAPADTRVYAEISPSWWARAGLNGWRPRADGQQAASQAELHRWARETLGLDWEADVAPWLRPDAGVIMRPAGTPGPGGAEASWWLGSGDDARARSALDKVSAHRAAAGEAVEERRHGGVDFTVFTPAGGRPYTLGLLAGYVVGTDAPQAMVTLIDHVNANGPSLASSNPRYRRLAGAWDRGAPGHAFVDLAEPNPPVGRRPPGDMPAPQALGAALTAGSDWMTVSVITAFDVAEAPPESRERWRAIVPPLDMRRFDRLPDASVLAVGATATPQTRAWIAGALALGWGPLGGGATEGLAFSALTSSLTSLEGPFALGVVAADPEADAADPVGAVLVAQPADPEALRDELERGARAVTSATDPARLPGQAGQWAAVPWVRAALPKATELVDETHGRAPWRVLRAGGQPLAGWTLDDGALVVAGGGEALRLAQAPDFKSLSRAGNFQAVRDRLPGDPGLYLYADGPNMLNLLAASPWLPAKYAGQARRAFAPLRAMGLSAGAGLDGRGFHRAGFTVLVDP